MDINTHKSINSRYSGKVVYISNKKARVVLHTNIDMVADETGLIHGGFIFSSADYAAMVAVNDENVVLGSSECRFIAPVKKGECVIFDAVSKSQNGRKIEVYVEGRVDGKTVFTGTFTTFVLKKHILSGN